MQNTANQNYPGAGPVTFYDTQPEN